MEIITVIKEQHGSFRALIVIYSTHQNVLSDHEARAVESGIYRRMLVEGQKDHVKRETEMSSTPKHLNYGSYSLHRINDVEFYLTVQKERL